MPGAVPNINSSQWQRELERGPFGLKGAMLGAAAGASKLGLTLYEISPGKRNMPYHAHYAVEELIIVLTGEVSLRSPEGVRALDPGEVVSCPAGESGAHQLINEGSEPARVLVASSKADADFIVYPDSNKLNAVSGEWGSPEAFRMILSMDEPLEYMQGELDPDEGETGDGEASGDE